MNNFNICPICGSKQIKNENNRKWLCSDCGFELYNNVASAVGLVIAAADNKILFEKRAKEPRKGFLAFPGGFVDPDETAEQACIRECIEETGVKPSNLEYLCSFPNTYEYNKIVYKTCDLFFKAEIPAKEQLKAQQGEVDGFERVLIQTEEDIEKLPLAFESARKTLKIWLKSIK